MRAALCALLFCVSAAADVSLVTFDGAEGTTFQWETLLDPVMGGQSNGTVHVKDGAAVFDAYCAIVPKLKAPGFVTMQTAGTHKFNDASTYSALKISVRSATPAYKGFKVSFAASTASDTFACATGKNVLGGGCFKSAFNATSEWSDIVIPFTSFTDEWNAATGQPTGQRPPSRRNLKEIQRFSFWGEGAEGRVQLEVRGIYAVTKTSANDRTDAGPVPLVTFDGKEGTTFKWRENDDPVMGGQSAGTFRVNSNSTATFDGECRIVPSLKAPGFTKAETERGLLSHPHFNDASALIDGGLELRLRTESPGYKGHKLSFGPAYGQQIFNEFKAPFYPSNTSQWQKVYIAFSDFSSDWSGYTGECSTKDPNGKQHYCCDAAHPEVCVKAKKLSEIASMSIWSEGVAGRYHLEIESITAVPRPSA